MGLSSRFSSVALALFGSTLFLQETRSQLTECSASTSADFDYEVTVETGFDIRWSVDTEAEAISFEVSTATEAWVSVGFSADGMMIGSDAVIGLPGGASEIAEYDLIDQDIEMVVLYEEQEITNGAVTQGSNSTTITFTRPLAPTTSGKETLSATPGDEHWLIYAVGADNDLAYHGGDEHRGSVLLDLFCGDSVITSSSAPSATPTTPAPLAEGVSPAPTTTPVDGGGDGGSFSVAPTALGTDASDSPTAGEDDDGEDDDGGDTTREADAAFRVNGGLWVAAATVVAAVLGAAMAV